MEHSGYYGKGSDEVNKVPDSIAEKLVCYDYQTDSKECFNKPPLIEELVDIDYSTYSRKELMLEISQLKLKLHRIDLIIKNKL